MPRRLVAFLLAAITLLVIAPAAQADRTFTTRFAADEFGDIVTAGNTLVTCPAADPDCANARLGTGTTRLTDNVFDMVPVNQDSAAGLTNSSAATVSLPAGATVIFAGLYWGADTVAGTTPSGATASGRTLSGNLSLAGAAQIKVPGASAYTAVTAANLDTWGTAGRYGAFADVTSLVRSGGAGSYTVGGIQLATGGDKYAGWSLVVAYKTGSGTERNLRVADGLAGVTNAATTVSIPINGLSVPSGTPSAKVTVASYEGDLANTGDTAKLNTTTLTDALNPANDVFNSTQSYLGTRVSTKSPDYANQLGMDLDTFDATGILSAGATSATLNLTTGGEVYAPAMIATAIQRAPSTPSNEVDPSLSGTAADGQTLTADHGTWNGTPNITYGYQWQRCTAAGTSCAAISGATSTSYTLASADVGSTVRVLVSAGNSLGTTTDTSAVSGTVAAVAPVNTVAPAVSGTTRDGQTLTATDGTWTGTTPMTRATKWQRCSAAGTSCVDIAGATSATYTLTSADVGVTVRPVVTMTNTAGSASANGATSAVITATPPVNTVAPVVTGTLRDGQTLTSATGTWTGTPTLTYARRWQRCDSAGSGCADIPGATGTTYTLTPADAGATVRIVVTATNAAGSASASGTPSAPVAAIAPANTIAPTVTGTPADGTELTAAPGTWTGTPVLAYAYRWQRCDTAGAGCTDIPGATASRYTSTGDDVARRLRVVVTASNVAGSAAATGAPTAAVAASAPVSTVAPVVTGTQRVGETLSTDSGRWSGTGPFQMAYQWQRCDAQGTTCVAIPGATGSSYTLTSADDGALVRAVVTASNTVGSAAAAASPTRSVTQVPTLRTPPVITGTLLPGETLSATPGTWTSSSPLTYRSRWLRCDDEGANCVAVPGATGSTYTLTDADSGAVMKVEVTAVDADGLTSAPAAAGATDADAGTSIVSDLGALPDSLVSAARCATPTSALIARSVRLQGVRGKVKLALETTGTTITPTTPLRLVATAPARSIRTMKVTVDGKALRGTAISPAFVAGGRTHRIVARLRPRRGAGRTLTMLLTTARCSPVFTVTAKRGVRSRTVLLRVDSRQAVTAVRYTVSAAMATALRTAKRSHRGTLQVTSRGAKGAWKRGVWNLTAGKGGSLLATAGAPAAKLSGRTVTVTGLPAASGIVTISVPAAANTHGRFRATATLAGNRTAALRSRLGGKRRTR